ncbi:K(+)-transporting ATPase subunit F [Chitinilyticum litopenaei]|nr:K(+)-transporting ATPase subunit F [Chitinilyticum litopenaei]
MNLIDIIAAALLAGLLAYLFYALFKPEQF